MKYISVLVFLIAANLNAQTILQFDRRLIDSEDKWVAFQKNKDSAYTYGFIYVDEQAGLTLNYEGTFTITSTGKFVPKKTENATFKVRLEPGNILVALIPESKFQELEIPAVPEWLASYKTDTNSIARLYRRGFLYNAWNECAKALTFLKKAEGMAPDYEGLAVELAYSYNCLNQFDKAILVLQTALQANPADAYINKELIYAQIKSGQLNKAGESCKKAIAACKDPSYNGENCYNILHSYYLNKDKANFMLWLPEAKKWASNNAGMVNGIKAMEQEMNK